METLNLHDRVALVTGGGTGIGAATAELLARRGAAVVVTGRRPGPLGQTVERIEAEGGKALLVAGDVADADAAHAMVDAAVERFGRLDLLVNNAGIYQPSAAAEGDLDNWDRHFAINLRGPVALCHAAYSHLEASSAGVVINVLSNLALRPVPGVSAYCASKAALLSFTRSLAVEWAPVGIRAVAVAPGIVDTPIHGEGGVAGLEGLQPLGRVGRSEEIAAAIAFLASDASAWTTGAVLEIDGGMHLV